MTTQAAAAHADADREMLVFGVSGKKILHISEAARGAACGCVCPGCGAALVAKQGAVVEHHFAHASGQDCQTARESAIHLFAKRAFAERMLLALPEVVLSGQTDGDETITVSRPGATEAFDRVLEEDRRRPGFIPDATGFQGADETIVEFAFTHLVGEEKLELLNATGLRAVEIYLSAVNTSADMAAIADEILFKAPRKWLWHPPVADMVTELRARIARANEAERIAREVVEEAERKAQAAREIITEAARKMINARSAVQPVPEDEESVGIRRRIREAGLDSLTGIRLRGDWLFNENCKQWQSRFIADIVLIGHNFSQDSIRLWLQKRCVNSPMFRELRNLHNQDLLAEFHEVDDFINPEDILRHYIRILCMREIVTLRKGGLRSLFWWSVSKETLAKMAHEEADRVARRATTPPMPPVMKLGLGRGVVLKKTPFEHPATLPQAAAPPPPPPTANLPLPVLRPMFARRVVQPESAHAADPQ